MSVATEDNAVVNSRVTSLDDGRWVNASEVKAADRLCVQLTHPDFPEVVMHSNLWESGKTVDEVMDLFATYIAGLRARLGSNQGR